MFFWENKRDITLQFIQSGKPTQNAFVESFNRKYQNEFLNQHWFRSLDEARRKIKQWQKRYNHVRPHSALGYLTPVESAKRAA